MTTKLAFGLTIDVIAPLALYYGSRAIGANVWLALLIGGLLPVVQVVVSLVRRQRPDRLMLFVLCMMVVGTAVSIWSGSPRVLLARDSWATAVLGLWVLASLAGQGEPFVLTGLKRVLPAAAAAGWTRKWETDPLFRHGMRVATAGWGAAFLVDSAARIVMAVTLPVDLVPVLSTSVLLVLLVVVNQGSKAYGRRLGRAGTDAAL